jgi:hypothetical protein
VSSTVVDVGYRMVSLIKHVVYRNADDAHLVCDLTEVHGLKVWIIYKVAIP